MSLWWLVPLISLTHQNLVLLPKKTWCWWLNLLPPANHFLSFVLHLKQEMDKAQCYYYSHDICFTAESSFDPAESCHCDNSGHQSPYEGHVQKSSLQNGLIYLCCMEKQKPTLMLHLITMPDRWRLFIAIKLAFVWWHQQTRPGRLNPAWTHLQCLWGRREEMKCFLWVPTAQFNDTIIARYLPDNCGKCWRNTLDLIPHQDYMDFSSLLPLSLSSRTFLYIL